jgi:tryptophan synthase alpha chain
MNYELTDTFNQLRQQGRKALIPYFTALYPSRRLFEQSVMAAAKAGADLIEIGLPFSDPMADGPVIQHSSHYALTHGFSIDRMFRSIKRLTVKIRTPRAAGIASGDARLIIMTYLNPVLKRGIKKFAKDCKKSGVNGLIVPDLIPESGGVLEKELARAGLVINYLVAPNTSAQRIRLIAARTTGFIYLVSIAGVTGERKTLPAYLPAVVRRIRAVTNKPLCIGFGISTPDQAKAAARLADGVIIGSALVKIANRPDKVAEFLKDIRKSIS